MNTPLGHTRLRPAVLAAVAVVAVVTPFVIRDTYVLGVLVLGLIWLTLNQSWNLVLGTAGVWNFGHLAVYAVGGYTAGLLTLHTAAPAWLALPAGGVLAAAVSVVLGAATLRLRGIYVALLTFSFAYVIQLVITADRSGFTGGSFGLAGYRVLTFGAGEADALVRGYYWTALGIAAVTVAVLAVLDRSPMGFALVALRENAALAAARGIDPTRYRLLSFGISGFFGGLAGALYAFYYGAITPSVMGLAPLTLLVTMLVVGGLGTLSGPAVGTGLLLTVQTLLEDRPEERAIVLGLVLLLVVVLMPRGIVAAAADVNRRIERWIAEDEEDALTEVSR